ncbi:F-box/LRR-repeat protein 17-like [Asterias rubens]|uniref:F-box/LRR-repeat protein 17-like n=1 Tax=Asterias rubens TaxID=7604 RepID=UPI001454FF83|nr:F-box/LRR-repeat protein 17-like [Asterias rubens]
MEETRSHNSSKEPNSILDDMKYLDTDSTVASVGVLSSHVVLPCFAQLSLVGIEDGSSEATTSAHQENCPYSTLVNSETNIALDAHSNVSFQQGLDLSAALPYASQTHDLELSQPSSTTAEKKGDEESTVSTGETRPQNDQWNTLARTNTSKLCNKYSETKFAGFDHRAKSIGVIQQKDENFETFHDANDTFEDTFEEMIHCDGCLDEDLQIRDRCPDIRDSESFSEEERIVRSCQKTSYPNLKCPDPLRLKKAWEVPSDFDIEACEDVQLHVVGCVESSTHRTLRSELAKNDETHQHNLHLPSPSFPPCLDSDADPQLDQKSEPSQLNAGQEASFSLFDELPREIFYKVLSYFSLRELCVTLAPVCRAWCEYSYSPVLWQDLDLSANPDISSKQLDMLLERATLLKTLRLRGRQQLSVYEIEMLVKCPLLTRLDLGFCDIVNRRILVEIVRCCPSLQVVNMEGCDRIDDQVAAQFPQLPLLKKLNLSHCTKMTDEAVLLIAQGCLVLEELNVDGIPWITDRAIELLAADRSGTLRAVYLDGAELTDLSIKYLIGCPSLHTLSLSFCEQLTDTALSMLQKVNSLRHLRLRRGVEFTEDALCSFFSRGNVQSLSFLDLSECSELTDKGVANIAHRCSQLSNLALCWCWNVSDAGIDEIVQHCSELKYLDIVGLDKVKGQCFTRIPDALPRLTFLDLRQCNLINDTILIDLVKTKPGLNIINYYGEEVTPNMLF